MVGRHLAIILKNNTKKKFWSYKYTDTVHRSWCLCVPMPLLQLSCPLVLRRYDIHPVLVLYLATGPSMDLNMCAVCAQHDKVGVVHNSVEGADSEVCHCVWISWADGVRLCLSNCKSVPHQIWMSAPQAQEWHVSCWMLPSHSLLLNGALVGDSSAQLCFLSGFGSSTGLTLSDELSVEGGHGPLVACRILKDDVDLLAVDACTDEPFFYHRQRIKPLPYISARTWYIKACSRNHFGNMRTWPYCWWLEQTFNPLSDTELQPAAGYLSSAKRVETIGNSL